MGDDIEPAELRALVERLDLDRKVELLSGGSTWATSGNTDIDLRSMAMSDGPSGVRGQLWDERSTSLLLPCATALASSWDVALARRYGSVSAQEARRKEVDVILGPTVNLHRSPLGGRSFEAFSEDPVLTSELAAAYISGVQSNGVAAAVKHYVANDSETDRFTADIEVGERALRELYLMPFEKAVTQAGVWAVMSAYNSVNGTTATENELLDRPLTSEWGFEGVVVSDWGAVRSVNSARGRQDLAMPGPQTAWGQALVDAVRSGDIDEALIDRKIERILRLASRVGALGDRLPGSVRTEDGPRFARETAAQGMVLVRNAGALPLDPSTVKRIAVSGHNAKQARAQGGGSATVIPDYVISPLAGLRAATPDSVTIDYAVGAVVQVGIAVFERDQIVNPLTDAPGARVSYLGGDGQEIFAEDRYSGFLIDFGDNPHTAGVVSLVFDTMYLPDSTGPINLGFASPGTGRMFVDGVLRLAATISPAGPDQVGAFFAPESISATVDAVAGAPIRLRFEFEPGEIIDGIEGSFTAWFGTEQPPSSGDALIAEAVSAARAADVAVVVVGTNSQVECEGYDRTDLILPGRQDDLVAAVAAVNPNTIVVVNAGAPVEMRWRHDVAAILLGWFGGQEFGAALADVLYGRVEPGGRLTTTWPVSLGDVPVSDVTPHDGVVRYDEGIHIGYRAWIKVGVEPAYPFGAGLGYTQWDIGPAVVHQVVETGGLRVAVDVANTGVREGKQVVQVYARRPHSRVDRPRLWLVGFGVVRAAAGERAALTIDVPRRAFAYWDNGWVDEPGDYELLIGTSSADLGAPITVPLAGGERAVTA